MESQQADWGRGKGRKQANAHTTAPGCPAECRDTGCQGGEGCAASGEGGGRATVKTMKLEVLQDQHREQRWFRQLCQGPGRRWGTGRAWAPSHRGERPPVTSQKGQGRGWRHGRTVLWCGKAEGDSGRDLNQQGCRVRGGSRSQPSGWQGCDFSAWLTTNSSNTQWGDPQPSGLLHGGRPLWHSTKPITATPTSRPCRHTPPAAAALQATCASGLPLASLPASSHGLWTEAPTVCTLGLPHRAWRGAGHTAAPGRVTQPHLLPLPQPRLLPHPHPTPKSTASTSRVSAGCGEHRLWCCWGLKLPGLGGRLPPMPVSSPPFICFLLRKMAAAALEADR